MLNEPGSHDQPPPLHKKTSTEILVRVCTGFILQEGNTETSLPSFCPPELGQKSRSNWFGLCVNCRSSLFSPPFVLSLSLGKRGQVRARKKHGEKKAAMWLLCYFCLFIVLFIVSTGCIETGRLTKRQTNKILVSFLAHQVLPEVLTDPPITSYTARTLELSLFLRNISKAEPGGGSAPLGCFTGATGSTSEAPS